jgi:hypothetical integral membrane protein (TIGR02206 family)
MSQFFDVNFQGTPFAYLGATHLGALAFLILLNLFFMRFRNASEGINEAVWHYWTYINGMWNVQTMLPLHLCSLLVWTGAYMLVTKNYRVYEFMYFMGIGGAIQALATPGIAPYGFPHFLYFQYFLSHGLIITSAIFMTVVEGLRPTWKSMLRVFVWMNIYAAIIYFVNGYLGSNYLMINYKPTTPSLLDLLPPWPIYIVYMEVIGVSTMLLLYLPFAVKDWRTYYLVNRDNASRLESISK